MRSVFKNRDVIIDYSYSSLIDYQQGTLHFVARAFLLTRPKEKRQTRAAPCSAHFLFFSLK